jgi:prepilin-type N-terminal cleavage/methylation domain-containing protein/prepilin-type processing-associated H-X9-DG protein
MRRRGLTLIEVIVVCTIIAVVAAIVFPMYARAKATAHNTTCLSNVRQITTALLMYMDEHRYPPVYLEPSWLTALGLESGRKVKLRCPLFRPRFRATDINDLKSGYTFNTCLNVTILNGPPENPSTTVAVAETGSFVRPSHDVSIEDDVVTSLQGPDCLVYNADVIQRGGLVRYSLQGCDRHLGGANYGMLDGRAVWRKPSQVRFYDTSLMQNPKPYENWPCLMRPGGRWVGPKDGITFQVIP